MQLPHSKTRQTYIDHIANIESRLKNATSGAVKLAQLAAVQKQLDNVADTYQYNEEIGTARYKLYELQALVHYFQGEDEAALDFINQAIELRGSNYARAEKLKSQLLAKAAYSTDSVDTLSKGDRRERLIGLEGWLALFIVGTSLGILLGIINLIGYPAAFNDLASAQEQLPALVSALSPALWFEILTNIGTIALAIWLIVLLAQRKRLAKKIAFIYLLSTPLLAIVDYAWVSAVFESFNLGSDIQRELSSAAGDAGRSVIAACIWVPYFAVSKRVKVTLTRK